MKTVEDEIRLLGFDVHASLKYTQAGRLEEWIHQYLNTGAWANPGLSEGLRLQKRWWNGPLEVDLGDLSRAVGPEEGMEYRVESAPWYQRIHLLAESLTGPLAIPPLIAEYRRGALSVRDGNTRLAAMEILGWQQCWVIVWYNHEEDFLRHSAELLKGRSGDSSSLSSG